MNDQHQLPSTLILHGTGAVYGGASKMTKILIEEISKRGGEMFLCYNKDNKILNNTGRIHTKIALPLSTRNPLVFLLNLKKIIRFVKKNRITVIHANHRNDVIYSCFVKHLIPFKLEIFYTVHGISVVGDEKKIFYKMLQKLFFFLVNNNIKRNIYISGYTLEKTRPFFSKVKEHKVVHNGVRKPLVNLSKIGVLKKIGLPEGVFIVSLIGDVGGVKRPETVLLLAEKLKFIENLYFLVIGDGNLKEKLVKETKERNLNNIKFLNSTSLIGNYINATDILISTAFEEGFGLTLIEAMSLKKPTIAFNSGGPKEIIAHGVNGFLINKGDIQDFANKILLLMEDEELYRDYGCKGFSLYKKKFTEQVYVNNYSSSLVNM